MEDIFCFYFTIRVLLIPADVESPSFGLTCPSDIRQYADRAKNYTTVTWPPVIAIDNSGKQPNLTSTGVTRIYYKGKHKVVYNATDEVGNYRICKFHITVEGRLLAIYLHAKL